MVVLFLLSFLAEGKEDNDRNKEVGRGGNREEVPALSPLTKLGNSTTRRGAC
jgi:hypothetical protein